MAISIGIAVERETKIKYLVILLDPKPLWKTHAETQMAKSEDYSKKEWEILPENTSLNIYCNNTINDYLWSGNLAHLIYEIFNSFNFIILIMLYYRYSDQMRAEICLNSKKIDFLSRAEHDDKLSFR